jgi:class 3 adenylate cyclase
MQGKRKSYKKITHQTILFADIRGFSRGLFINSLRHVTDIIYDFYVVGSKILKDTIYLHFSGDEILASFREPNTAVQCAFNFRDQVTPFLSKVGLDVGIGIHEDKVCSMYTNNSNFRTIHIGLAYNIAKRLEQISYGGDITISRKVYLTLEGKLQEQFTLKQEYKLRGFVKPVTIWVSMR